MARPSTRNRLRVSVVIPARDARATIARAVTSAAQQTQPPLEIIVVDDGSTDGTEAVLRELPVVRPLIVRTAGIGVAGARNTGARRALGDWIAFLDSDDSWAVDFLAAASQAIARSPSALACFAAAVHVD
ncbi:MAG: glycosyltransferase family 2 protein, partial [Actinomycetota bacterium]|nr:glycosyltransferase family 2 protein [Actinomycetota bacterium]